PKAVQAAGLPAPPTTKLVTGYGVDSKQGVRRAPPPTFRLALLEPLFPQAAPGLPLGNYSPAPNLPITPCLSWLYLVYCLTTQKSRPSLVTFDRIVHFIGTFRNRL